VYCDNGSAAFRSKPVNPVADRNGAIRCRKKNPPSVNRWPVSSVRIGATYVGLLGNNNFASAEITIGNVSAPLQGNAGSFTPTVGGFSSGISLKGNGVNLFTILDFSSTFDFTQNQLVADGSLNFTNGPATRNLDFNITSETLVLSPVPLPPALPLFAAALLALGIFGYVRRAKDVTPAHGQAY
jgi:hypothetical protein